jgi:3,4-dihydroxy-9,10-secoandrosta-1,3,5(10)-triene-9,17-dione 4,5-dioxygenase
MSGVIAYGYIGLTAPDVDAWRAFATDVMGMTVQDGPDEGQIVLRMDGRSWRLSVEPGAGGLAFSGWEVADARALAQVVAILETAGIATKEDPELAAKRRVRGLVTCEDPSGNRIELFHGAFVPKTPFRSPTGTAFVTSAPGFGDLGFGHAVIMVPDESEAERFYLDLLGFRLSDTLTAGPVTANFTHVNGRHHSLAYAQLPNRVSMLNHIMVEVADLDMVGRALDVVTGGAAPLIQTLGRHTNDHMVSFYTQTPSGFMLEYGCHGLLIDDTTWTTSSYDRASFWGHAGDFPDGSVDI